MKMLLIALRNLFRNKRRTVLTLAAISFGLSMMIWTVNFQNGSYQMMIDKTISTMAGHVVIQAEGYQEEKEPTLVVEGAGGITEALRAEFPGAVVAPRIFVGGLLMSASNSVGAAVSGVDGDAEAQVQEIDEKIVEGAWLGNDPREILIGRDMADSLEVGLDDKIIYMGQNEGDEEMTSKLFRVRGIFRTGASELDGFVAITHLESAQELLGGGDVANMVTLHFDDADSADAAIQQIEAMNLTEAEILHWREALTEIFALIQMDRGGGDFMLFIIGVIVAFGVLNTLLMSVLERTREFGVMLSLGMKPRQIAWLVLLEGLVLGTLGAIGGLLLGLLMSWPAVIYGIDFSKMMGTEQMESGGISFDAHMYGAWDPDRMAVYFCGAVLFCLLAAVYPAWTISKLRPVEALRHH
jgi:ABC-type lipoprotein release transport system permease subunit